MRFLLALLAAVAGTGQPIQAAMNAKLREALQSPTLASALSLLSGALALGLLTVMGPLGRGSFAQAGQAPWWAWFGGLIGAASVTVNLMALPKAGAALTIGAGLVGQLLAAAAVDHFGVLGVEKVPLQWPRIVGLVLLLAGIVLVQVQKK